MTLTRLAAIALAALVLPDAASAGLATIRSQEIPVGTARHLAAAGRDSFDLVGVHWRGAGSVELRARSLSGRWSEWHVAAPEEDDAPDRGSAENTRRGWRLGSPWWVGPSDRLEVRTRGRVTQVRAWKVRSPESLVPLRRVAAAAEPAIVPRSTWGADESIRRGEPSYATELRYAVVHHTAGANGYTKAQAPAILRGIQLYHVQANGWNDIGYNFLVDRFGTVYEGRYGGADANVIGAQAQGFNTGSVGVAVLGTYGGTPASTAAEQALVRLLAWRLDVGHADAGAMLTVVSGGSPKHAAGVPVLLRAVSGHRDVGLTACPGDALYARLQAIGAETRRTGLPKLYEPVVAVEGTSVLFRARLSKSLPWTVSLTDAQGAAVASGSGTGTTLDWAWDAAGATAGDYRWTMSAGSGSARVTPATGIVTTEAGSAQLALNAVTVRPAVLSPNGDGVEDTAELAYTLTTAATVSVAAVDAAGVEVAQVEAPRWRRAGAHAVLVRRRGTTGRRLHAAPSGADGRRIRGDRSGRGRDLDDPGVRVARPAGVLAQRRRACGRAARRIHAHPPRHRHGARRARRLDRGHPLRGTARRGPTRDPVGRSEDGRHRRQRRVHRRRRRRRRGRDPARPRSPSRSTPQRRGSGSSLACPLASP